MNFRYYVPVKLFFGRNCVKENSRELTFHGRSTLIVTGKSSAEKNGSLSDIKAALESAGVKYTHYNGINPNPSVENVREAAEAARRCRAEFITGIGGGSPLDAAKAVAILAANRIDDETLFNGSWRKKPLPVAAVPTTAGTGSEVTPYSILTNKKINNKKSIASDAIFPALAFLDPSYTESLPPETTVNTAVDAMSHAIEGYLSARATDIIAPYAMESLRLIGLCTGQLQDKNIKYETREKLLYASMLAGIVIAHTGTTAVHAMGYPLTYYRNMDHGRANGLLLAHYLRFIGTGNGRVKDIIRSLGMRSVNEFEKIIKKLLGKPEELTDEEIDLFSETALTSKNLSNTVPQPGKADIKKMFTASFRG